MSDGAGDATAGGARRPVATRPVPAGRVPPRLTLGIVTVALVLAGELAAWTGQADAARYSGAPGVTWALSRASNTVTLRLTQGDGPGSRQVLGVSRLTVSVPQAGHRERRYAGAGTVRVRVPPGRQTRLVVQVNGPLPSRRTVTVTVPPALRVTAAHRGSGRLRLSLSAALRRSRPGRLCGRNKVSVLSPSEVAVASSPYQCRAKLTLTAQDGEQAVVPVTVPALPEVPLYSFASPAGRAIYITVDDGWTPSPRVLAVMRRTRLPVTAFLIEQAAQKHLAYWRAFVQAGGTIGDHTVSHPDLTKESLGQATVQWAVARQALGRWLGQAPRLGRPPYGAVNPAVRAAAHRGGLQILVGWSATVASGHIRTWDGRGLEAGEIVLLHWVPGLSRDLTTLLAAIHARNLHPVPLTPASFAGVTPQRQAQALTGD